MLPYGSIYVLIQTRAIRPIIVYMPRQFRKKLRIYRAKVITTKRANKIAKNDYIHSAMNILELDELVRYELDLSL